MNKLVSVVIPCYNEEGNISKFYKSIESVINKSNYKFELIFVDDGSTDNTLCELNKVLKNNNIKVNVISFSRNFGKEAAMYAGLEMSKGDYAIIIDVDLEQDPKLIIKMLETIYKNKEYDSVAFYQEKRKENKIISFLKNAFYKIINEVSDVKFTSGASDFRLLNRKMIDAIMSMKENNRFSKGIFSWVGFNTCYIPYEVGKRNSGESKWSLKKLIKYAFSGIRSFSFFELKIVDIISNLLLLTSVVYLICVLHNALAYKIIIFLILFVGGLIIKAISSVSKYLYDIYIEVKERPIYIAKEIISNEVKYER